MSDIAKAWAYEHVKTGKPHAKSVLVAIADDADSEGFSDILQETLVMKTELSLSTIKRCIKFLEKFQIIVVLRKQLDAQKRRNEYRLRIGYRFDLTGVISPVEAIQQPMATGVTQTPIDVELSSESVLAWPLEEEIPTSVSVNPIAENGVSRSPVENTSVCETPHTAQSDLTQVSAGHHSEEERCQRDPIHSSPVTHTNYLSTTNHSNYLDRKGQKEPMTRDWSPLDETFEVLREEGITEDSAISWLREFRLYWHDRGSSRDDFNTLFLKHCRYHAKQQSGESEPTDIKDKVAKRLEQLSDRSWMDS